MMLPIRQIFQEMAAEKMRLFLTILAVVWATLCITMMLATGEGLRQGLIRTSENGNGNLIYLTGGYASMTAGSFYQGKALSLQPDDINVIRQLPSIKAAEPTVEWDARVSYNDNPTWQNPLAVNPAYKELTGLSVAPGGRWLNPLDMIEQRKVIVIGNSAAAHLFSPPDEGDWMKPIQLTTNPVGKVVKLGDEEFTVIGVLERNSAQIEQGTPLDYAMFVPFTTWERFHQNAAISAINILPHPTVVRERVASTVKQVLARKYGASPLDISLLQAEDMLLRQKTMRRFLIGLQSFLGLIGLITLSVAGIGIANVMYATVKRSTRDIGVRMAVGATPTTIKLHYLVQALLTMSIGGLFGLTLTYGAVTLIKSISFEDNMLYQELGQPIPELSLPVVGIVIFALILVGVASAWFPAKKAANVTPLEALQSE
ncbi:ABC transporter permease [Vibrio sp. Of7-15]|uniref:ABC transporter permease n=1 Tax=Vibrio sp. Of7-15 TaxID=2724879 RepID=UPI001EF2DE99|nr:ABC transporter permease [Vibrio sp. Of7-15]MCG7498068.1 ABC transporter permease [Vibrio sp. Of7-15]